MLARFVSWELELIVDPARCCYEAVHASAQVQASSPRWDTSSNLSAASFSFQWSVVSDLTRWTRKSSRGFASCCKMSTWRPQQVSRLRNRQAHSSSAGRGANQAYRYCREAAAQNTGTRPGQGLIQSQSVDTSRSERKCREHLTLGTTMLVQGHFV